MGRCCTDVVQDQGGQGSQEEHVVYVWLDALVNYMSAVDAPVVSAASGSDADSGSDTAGVSARQHYWPPDVHVVC